MVTTPWHRALARAARRSRTSRRASRNCSGSYVACRAEVPVRPRRIPRGPLLATLTHAHPPGIPKSPGEHPTKRLPSIGLLIVLASCAGSQRSFTPDASPNDAPASRSRFSDDFICNLPSTHGDSYWCEHHNQCHGLGKGPRCEWTNECRPKMPFFARGWQSQARIVETDCTVTWVKPGDTIATGAKIVEIRDDTLVL